MKAAFTTVLDDKYMAGFLVTLSSLLNVSENFNHDIVILEWGKLSQANKQLIQSLYKNVIFRFIDTKLYENHSYDRTYREWTYNCNYRFDIFTFTEYDKVVFFDSDIIFQIDANEILSYDVDFGACAAQLGSVSQINTEKGFDGGVMLVGKKFLNLETREELLKIAEMPAPKEKHLNTTKWTSDEPILNTYFLDKMEWLPDKYNFVIPKLDSKSIKLPNNYQFVGHNKPWYGSTIQEQFSSHVIESIQQNTNSGVMVPIITKTLLKLFQNEVVRLLEKNINIYDYTGQIKPSYYE